MKKIIIILLCVTMVYAYTAPDRTDVELVLPVSYTAPDRTDVELVIDVPGAADTCSCAGLDTNWEVDLTDYCVIVDNCDLGTGTLSFINTGNFTCDAIISTTDIGDPGSGGILYTRDDCVINVDS